MDVGDIKIVYFDDDGRAVKDYQTAIKNRKESSPFQEAGRDPETFVKSAAVDVGSIKIVEFDQETASEKLQARQAPVTEKDVGHIKIIEFDNETGGEKEQTKQASPTEGDVGYIKIVDFDKEKEKEKENRNRGVEKIKILYFD